jgi:hypothetical protein
MGSVMLCITEPIFHLIFYKSVDRRNIRVENPIFEMALTDSLADMPQSDTALSGPVGADGIE